MYGGCNMQENNFSLSNTNSYIDKLIDQCFSILPLYEENGNCQILSQKLDNLIYKLNGFFNMNNFDSNITTDILSYANNLKSFNNHVEVRCCVLKICSLLSRLKVVIE